MNELDKKFPLGDRAWFELAVGARPLTPKEEQKLVKEWPEIKASIWEGISLDELGKRLKEGDAE